MPDKSKVLRIGEWRVDPELDELSREGQTIRVEPRTMQLLLYLAAHAGRVIDVQKLLDEVWPNVVVTQGSVYQAIAQLRRILGDDSERPTYIENLPRRGYRLIAPVTAWDAPKVVATEPTPPVPDAPNQAQIDSVAAEQQGTSVSLVSGRTITPDVVPLPPPAVPTGRPRHGAALGAIAFAVVILAGIALTAIWRARHMQMTGAPVGGKLEVLVTPALATFAPPQHSIAVLPFVDMSEKHDQEYFADGMSEEILNLLVKVPGVKVIGRASSFLFKDGGADIRKAGEQLGAAYLVQGSVRRSGGRIRVAAQLIDVQHGAHKWSDTFDRAVDDALKVQHDVASGIAHALQLEVDSLEASQQGASSPLPQAYDLYLRGLHAQDHYDRPGFEEAVADLQRAVELDPNFLPAAESLAFVLRNQVNWEYVPPEEGWERTRSAATSAIHLSERSALAHAILGDVHTEYDWDWAAAEKELKTAQSLAPGNPRVLQLAGVYKLAVGQWSEAVRLFDAELSVDPLDPSARAFRSWAYMRLGRYQDSEKDQRALLSFSPSFGWAHNYLGIDLLMEGRNTEALEEMKLEAPENGQLLGLAVAYYALNRRQEADSALDRLIAEHAKDWAISIAETYAFRHEPELALKWLNRAYDQKDGALYYVKGDPLLVNLEIDPRYKAFLRKMNLPE